MILEKNIIITQPLKENYDMSIRTMLEKYNLSEEMVYIISKKEPLEGINAYVKKTLTKYESQKLK